MATAVLIIGLAVPAPGHTWSTTPAAAASPGACTRAWDGGGGTTDWHNDANWSPDGPPGTADVACIPAGTSVSLDGAGAHVAGLDSDGSLVVTTQLTVDGPSEVAALTIASIGFSVVGIDGAGSLTVVPGGSMTWLSGTVAVAEGLSVAAGASLTLAGTSVTHTLAAPLTNEGSLIWSDGSLSLITSVSTPNPMIDNRGAWVVDVSTGQRNIALSTGPSQPRLASTAPGATFSVINTSGVTRELLFSNVDSTIRDLTATGTGTTVNGRTNATTTLTGDQINFATGTQLVNNDASLIIAGHLVGDGSLQAGGSTTFNPGSGFDWHSITVFAPAILTTNIELAPTTFTVGPPHPFGGATITGPGNIRVPSGATLTSLGANLTGTGTVHIEPGGTLSIVGNTNLGRPLTNDGAVSWTGGSLALITSVSTPNPMIDNRGAWVVDVSTGQRNIALSTGPSQPRLASTAPGATFSVVNTSGVAGELLFSDVDSTIRDLTATGTGTTVNGRTNATTTLTGDQINFATGTQLVNNDASLIIAGHLVGDGSLQAGGSTTFNPGSGFDWHSITVFAPATFTTNIELAPTTFTLGPPHPFGGATITGPGNIRVPSGATLTSLGGNLTGTGTLHIEPGGTARMTGTTTVTRRVDNAGRLAVIIGTTTLSGGVTQLPGTTLLAGSWEVDSPATLTIPGADIRRNDGTIILSGPTPHLTDTINQNALRNLATNAGVIHLLNDADLAGLGSLVNSGDLDLAFDASLSVGSFTQTGTGRLFMGIAGIEPGISHAVVLASGAVAIDGSLNLLTPLSFAPASADIRLIDGASSSGRFAEVTGASLSNGNRWLVSYDDANGDIFLGVGGPSAGCDRVWDGGAGDGRWQTAANWSGDALPGPTEVACVPDGAGTIDYDGGNTTVAALIVQAGSHPARVVVSAGTLAVSGEADVAGAIQLAGPAILDPNGPPVPHLVLDGDSTIADLTVDLFSTLDGTGTVTIPDGGHLLWAGELAGSGALELAAGATADVAPFGLAGLARSLHNRGTITWHGFPIELRPGGALTNDALIDILPEPGGAAAVLGIGEGSITNGPAGTIRLTTRGTVAVDVDAASLGGTIDLVAGSRLVLVAGTFTWTAALTGTGTLAVTGRFTDNGDLRAARLIVNTPLTLTNLATETFGIIDGAAQVTVTGHLDADGGDFRGTGTLAIASGATVDLRCCITRIDRVVANHGTIHWRGFPVDVTANGAITNDGTLALDVAGTLHLGDEFVDAGTIELAPGALLDVPGTLTLTPDATVRVAVAGTSPATHGSITAGTASVAGSLDIVTNAAFTPAEGDVIVVVTADNRSGTFTTTHGTDAGGGLTWAVEPMAGAIQLRAVRNVGPDIGAALDQAVAAAGLALPSWAPAFDLDGVALPVITTDLADAFALSDILAGLGNPIAGVRGDLASVASAVEAAGCTVDFVADGIGGRPASTNIGDLIQIRCHPAAGAIEQDPAFAGDSFGDGTPELLDGLGAAVDLDALFVLAGNLATDVVVGVDAGGAYISGDTAVRLNIALPADAAVAGSATVAGLAGAAASGSAVADLAVTVGPAGTGVRVRPAGVDDLLATLAPSVSGTAALDLDASVAGIDVGWHAAYTVATGPGGTTTVTTATTLGATLTSPAFADPISFSGTRIGAGWHLENVTPGPLSVGGFTMSDLDLGLDLSPAAVAMSGTATASVDPGGTGAVAPIPLDVSFAPGAFGLHGSFATDVLGVGADARLETASLGFDLTADLEAATFAVGVDVAADRLVLFPTDTAPSVGAVVATGISGSLDAAGNVEFDADSVDLSIGAAVVCHAGTQHVSFGPSLTGDLVHLGTVSCSMPALADLVVDFDDLRLSRSGVFSAGDVHVGVSQLNDVIGLGGVLPFELTDLTVEFPDRNDLSHSTLTVVGRFDFRPFAGLPFTPVIGLGGAAVTPSSPDEQNHFSFAAEVVGGVVRPLSVGELTLGFDDLRAGPLTLGAALTLGGIVDGEPVNTAGGSLSVLGGLSATGLDAITTTATGTLDTTPGGGRLDVSGSTTIDGSFGPLGIQYQGLQLHHRLIIVLDAGRLTVTPEVEGLAVESITIPVAGVLAFTGSAGHIDFTPDAGELVATDLDLSLDFVDADVLSGWGGDVDNLGIDADLQPVALPGFGVALHLPPNADLGLPEEFPFNVSRVGLVFPNLEIGEPFDASGMRVQVSGSINIQPPGEGSDPLFAAGVAVQGLEIDPQRLVDGDFPITGVQGGSAEVELFDVAGMTIGGRLGVGVVPEDDPQVFYIEVSGTFVAGGVGGGIDIVFSELGPVVAQITAPLGIPIEPSGTMLQDVSGGVLFGTESEGLLVEPTEPGTPSARSLLDTELFDTIGDVEVSPATIDRQLTEALARGESTWTTGALIELTGTITHVATVGMVQGHASIGINLVDGHLDLFGKADMTAFGLPVGAAGFYMDLADPVNPTMQFSLVNPDPSSPLSVLFPVSVVADAFLDTDGLAEGTGAAMATFLTSGTATTNAALQSVLTQLAADLQADAAAAAASAGIPRPLTAAVFAGLPPATLLTVQQLTTRLTSLLRSDPGTVLRELLRELSASAANLQEAGLTTAGQLRALAVNLLDGVRQAVRNSADQFFAVANPVFRIEGSIQPTVLGIPLGDPTDRISFRVTKDSLTIDLDTTLLGLVTRASAQAPFLAFLTQNPDNSPLTDSVHLAGELPVEGLVQTLLGGGGFPSLDLASSAWGVELTGNVGMYGIDLGGLGGLLVPPGNDVFVDEHTQRIYEQPAPADGAPPRTFDPTLVPLLDPADRAALAEHGGLVLSVNAQAPTLLVDPLPMLNGPLAPPSDPLQYPAWLAGLFNVAHQLTPVGIVQLYLPPPNSGGVARLSGLWDSRMLSVRLGNAALSVDDTGIRVSGTYPFGGFRGTATIEPTGEGELPRAGVEVSIGAGTSQPGALANAFTALSIPASLRPPSLGTATFRAFTPGFDPTALVADGSVDTVRRNGGIEAEAVLRIPDVLGGGTPTFRFAFTRTGDFDATAGISNRDIGVLHLDTATVTVRRATPAGSTTPVFSILIHGRGVLFGGPVTIDGVLSSAGFGSLELTLDTGESVDVGGFIIRAGFDLALSSAGADIAFDGLVVLPSWLSPAAGRTSARASGQFDATGDIDLALSVTNLALDPTGAIVLVEAPAERGVTPPLLRITRTGRTGTIAVDVRGQLQLVKPTGSFQLLAVDGSMSTAGVADLTAHFPTTGLALGTFSVNGVAHIRYDGRSASLVPPVFPTIAITVDGTMTVAQTVKLAQVDGAIDASGIRSLHVVVAANDSSGARLGMGALTLRNLSLGLTRVAAGAYQLDVGADADVAGAVTGAHLSGHLDGFGNGTLTIDLAAAQLSLYGLAITGASASITRTSTELRLNAAGTLTFLGRTLTISSFVALTATGPSGEFVMSTSGPLDFGGLTITPTLRLLVTPPSATTPAVVSVHFTDGTARLAGTDRDIHVAGDLATNGTGRLTIDLGGSLLRFTGTPFTVSGTFCLYRGATPGNVLDCSGAVGATSGATVAFVNGRNVSLGWDGVGQFSVSSFRLGTDGSANAVVPDRTFTLPRGATLRTASLAFRMELGGLSARLQIGSWGLTIPGLTASGTGGEFALPATSISAGDFAKVLVDGSYNLGALHFTGRVTAAKVGTVFSLAVAATLGGPGLASRPPRAAFGPVTLDLPEFTVASDGTFDVHAAANTLFGDADLGLTANDLRLRSRIVSGERQFGLVVDEPLLRLPVGNAVALADITIDSTGRIDQQLTGRSLNLGPVFDIEPGTYRLQLTTNSLILDLVESSANRPTVSALAGSDITLRTLHVSSSGAFSGSVRGVLRVFGRPLLTETFNLSLVNGVIRADMEGETSVNLGFISIATHGGGRFSSNGSFSFDGTGSFRYPATGSLVGFAIGGDVSFSVTSTNGISGSFSGFAQAPLGSATASGSISYRGRISGTLFFRDPNGKIITTRSFSLRIGTGYFAIYDGGGDVQYDIDLLPTNLFAFDDLDETAPVFTPSPPPNQTVNIDVPASGSAGVVYDLPDVDDDISEPDEIVLICNPAPGSQFTIGAHTISCTARDRAGHERVRSFTLTVNDTSTTAAASAAPGATLVYTGTGFAPGSPVEGLVASTPRTLGWFVAGADGTLTATVTLPGDLAPGQHHVMLVGRDPSGGRLLNEFALTVLAPGSDGAGGLGGAVSPGGSIPVTGVDIIDLALVALLLVASGAFLRRRTRPARVPHRPA